MRREIRASTSCLHLLGEVVRDHGQQHRQQDQAAQGGQDPHEARDGLGSLTERS